MLSHFLLPAARAQRLLRFTMCNRKAHAENQAEQEKRREENVLSCVKASCSEGAQHRAPDADKKEPHRRILVPAVAPTTPPIVRAAPA